MKKVFVLGLSLVFLLSVFSSTSFAASKKPSQPDDSNVLGVYNGQKIIGVKKVVNGQLVDVTFQEYVNAMEESKKLVSATNQQATPTTPTNTYSPNFYSYQNYHENGRYSYLAAAEKASATQGCPSNGGKCSITLGYTLTKQSSFSGNVTSDMKWPIKVQLGYQYTDSAQVSNTYQFTFNPGQTAYVTFAPRYLHSEGYEEIWYYDSVTPAFYAGNTGTVSTESPQRLSSGQLDGYVTAVIY
jgi:hypothetical protein